MKCGAPGCRRAAVRFMVLQWGRALTAEPFCSEHFFEEAERQDAKYEASRKR